MLSFSIKLFFVLIISFFVGNEKGFCQNLVPNPSFEDTVSCPTGIGQITKAKDWFSLKNSPDYYNDCSTSNIWGVPTNFMGYQFRYSGHAYMGMYTFNRPDTNYREYIGAFLNSPLLVGTKYYINFKASMSGGAFQKVNIASNKLGVLFSTVDYLASPPPFNNYCQMYADSVITDTLGWTTIRDSFIADSAYSFISVGNFFFNSLLDTIRLNPNILGKG